MAPGRPRLHGNLGRAGNGNNTVVLDVQRPLASVTHIEPVSVQRGIRAIDRHRSRRTGFVADIGVESAIDDAAVLNVQRSLPRVRFAHQEGVSRPRRSIAGNRYRARSAVQHEHEQVPKAADVAAARHEIAAGVDRYAADTGVADTAIGVFVPIIDVRHDIAGIDDPGSHCVREESNRCGKPEDQQ